MFIILDCIIVNCGFAPYTVWVYDCLCVLLQSLTHKRCLVGSLGSTLCCQVPKSYKPVIAAFGCPDLTLKLTSYKYAQMHAL